MNFRFAHYEPPKEPKRTSSRSTTSKSREPTKPQRRTSKVQQQKFHQQQLEEGKRRQESDDITSSSRKTQVDHGQRSVIQSGYPSAAVLESTTASKAIVEMIPHAEPAIYDTLAQAHAPSSVGNLVTMLGQGRIDPFGLYPVENVTPYVNEILDHALTHKWHRVVPLSAASSNPKSLIAPNGAIVHPVKRAWLQCALQYPVAFYALAYASSKHLSYLSHGWESFRQANMLRLSYKTEAVKLINEALQKLDDGPLPDALLIAILSLGAHGQRREPSSTAASPADSSSSSSTSEGSTLQQPNTIAVPKSPLATAQMLDFYGNMDLETAHMSTLRTLLARNNGVSSIQLPGLAGALELGDILNSTVTHQRVLLPPSRGVAPSIIPFLSSPSSPHPIYGTIPASHISNFPIKPSSLPPTSNTTKLLETVAAAKAVTAALNEYVYSNTTTVTLEDLTISRNFVQTSLLSLPPANKLWGETFALYDSLRIACLMYSDLVLFPVPAKTGVRPRLANMLRQVLDCYTMQKMWRGETSVLLWCVMLGAIASQSTDDGRWFLLKLRICSEMLELDRWGPVVLILKKLLWWEYVCEGVGSGCWDACWELQASRNERAAMADSIKQQELEQIIRAIDPSMESGFLPEATR